MTAAEFLALIDKHPLPWAACGLPGAGVTLGPDVSTEDFQAVLGALDDADGQRLADAAPALAAAAIRLLRAIDLHVERDVRNAAFEIEAAREIAALRAALPDGLRT